MPHDVLLDHDPSVLMQDSPRRVKQVLVERRKETSILLDRQERELVKKGPEVTKDEMWSLLEAKRFDKLQESAVNLQADLVYSQRCPKCTLQPPCKHYESPEQITMEAPAMLHSENFKRYLSPRKMKGLAMALKDQGAVNQFMGSF